MTSILDIYASQQFDRPGSQREYLALQIARRLGDLARVRDYIALLENFPEELIVGAFRAARATVPLSRNGFLAAFRSAVASSREELSDE